MTVIAGGVAGVGVVGPGAGVEGARVAGGVCDWWGVAGDAGVLVERRVETFVMFSPGVMLLRLPLGLLFGCGPSFSLSSSKSVDSSCHSVINYLPRTLPPPPHKKLQSQRGSTMPKKKKTYI